MEGFGRLCGGSTEIKVTTMPSSLPRIKSILRIIRILPMLPNFYVLKYPAYSEFLERFSLYPAFPLTIGSQNARKCQNIKIL